MKKYFLIFALLCIITLSWCSSQTSTYTYEYKCRWWSVNQWYVVTGSNSYALYYIMERWKALADNCLLLYVKKEGKDIFKSEAVK